MPLKFVNAEGQEVQGITANFVYADGKEAAFDADKAMSKITELNGECKTWREKASALEKSFEGLDPAEAREAIQFKKSSGGKKGDAEEVQRLVKEQLAGYQADFEKKLAEAQKLLGDKDTQLHQHLVGAQFDRSSWFVPKSEKEPAKTFLTPNKAKASYARNFHVEGGKVIPKWDDGTPILSRAKYGEPADFDEAIELLIEKDPEGPQILRSSVASGGGANGSGPRSADTSHLSLEAQMEQALSATRRVST